MDSRDLTPAQAERLLVVLRRQLSILNRLQQRMEHLGFPPGDRMYAATSAARNRTGELFVNLHYCSCATGVGRDAPVKAPAEPRPPATTPVPPTAPA